MARLITSGFESGSFDAEPGFFVLLGSPSAPSSSSPRSGSFCMSVSTSSSVQQGVEYSVSASTNVDYFVRFYFQKSANPANAITIWKVNNTLPSVMLSTRLNTNGTLDLLDLSGAQIGSSSAALASNTWYRIEVLIHRGVSGNDGSCELRIDGVTVSGTNVTNANVDTLAPGSLDFGITVAAISTATFKYDDIAFNSASAGAGGTTWPGQGKIIMLDPTADSAVGTGWTRDNAGATGLFNGVGNEPPTGIADTTAGSGLHQIRNATSNANTAYTATMSTYTAAGLQTGDTLTLLQWVVMTGAAAATSPKAGSARIATNPVDTGLASLGNFYQGSANAGTYPTGWKRAISAVFDSSNVTMPTSANFGTAPTMTVNQITASTRVAICCLMGIMVEYVPGPLPSGQFHGRHQATCPRPPARGRF